MFDYDYLYEENETEVVRGSFRDDYFPEQYDFYSIDEEYPRDYGSYDYFDVIY